MESFLLGNQTSALFGVAIVTGFGALFGGLVYKLLTDRRARREQFQTLGVYSKRTGFAVWATFVIAAFALSYWIYLTPFYAVTLSEATIELQYFYPTQTVALRRDEIDHVERRFEPSKAGMRYVLVIYAKDGRSYESVHAVAKIFDPAFNRVVSWVKAS